MSLWVPEVGGRVDPDSEAHDLLMSLFGGLAKAERNRIRHRVRVAMAAHASAGRWLEGRPPYGYMLVDAGPHPNPEKAASGARLHQLDLDPVTAPVVRRIFDLYVNESLGFKAIVRVLTAEGFPSPSAHDPVRNPHRPGHAWAASAVRAILSNPRYLGRHVFGRQRRHEPLIDPTQPALGHANRMRWQDTASWVTAELDTHPALIDHDTWDRAQRAMRARGRDNGGGGSPRSAPGRYALVGLIACQHCGRRMQGSHTRGNALYRCRVASTDYATTPDGHPATLAIREDRILTALGRWLVELFAPERIADVAAAVVEADRSRNADHPRLSHKRDARSPPPAARSNATSPLSRPVSTLRSSPIEPSKPRTRSPRRRPSSTTHPRHPSRSRTTRSSGANGPPRPAGAARRRRHPTARRRLPVPRHHARLSP